MNVAADSPAHQYNTNNSANGSNLSSPSAASIFADALSQPSPGFDNYMTFMTTLSLLMQLVQQIVDQVGGENDNGDGHNCGCGVNDQ